MRLIKCRYCTAHIAFAELMRAVVSVFVVFCGFLLPACHPVC